MNTHLGSRGKTRTQKNIIFTPMPCSITTQTRRFSVSANAVRVFITLLLIGWSATPARAQASWQAANDSSNRYFAKQDYEKAYDFGLKMIAEAEPLYARNPADTTLVTSLIRVGISQRLATKPDTAKGLAHATRALSLLTPKLKQTFLGAKVYSLNAIFNYLAGHHEKALEYAEIAADRLEKLGFKLSSPYWEVQRYRAAIYAATKDSAAQYKAIAIVRRLLPITTQLFGAKDSRNLNLLLFWGGAHNYLNSPESKQQTEADSVLNAAIALARQLPDSSIVSTLQVAGKYYMSQSKNAIARRYLNESIVRGRMLRLPKDYLSSLVNLIGVELADGQTATAEALCYQVINDSLSSKCPECRVVALLDLSDMQVHAAAFGEAKLTTQQALTTIQQAFPGKNHRFYPLALSAVARIAYLAGDLDKSTRMFDEAFATAERIMPNDPQILPMGYYYGVVMAGIDDEKALAVTRKVYTVLKKLPEHRQNEYDIMLLTNEVALLRGAGRNEQAVQLADSVFHTYSVAELSRRMLFSNFLNEVMQTYLRANRSADVDRVAALAKTLLAQEMYTAADRTIFHDIIGRYAQAGHNYKEAVFHYEKEFEIDTIARNVSYINHSSLNRLAICQIGAGQLSAALNSYRTLVRQFDENIRFNLWTMTDIERLKYVQATSVHSLYWHFLQNSVAEPEVLQLAYDYRLLRQGVLAKVTRTINEIAHTISGAATQATISQLVNTRNQITARQQPDDLTKNRLLQRADSLQRLLGGTASAVNLATKPVHWQDVQLALRDDEAAIEIIRYYQYDMNGQNTSDTIRYAALLLRKDWKMPRIVLLPYREINGQTGLRDYKAYLKQAKPSGNWYEHYWLPIQQALEAPRKVYVSPDGIYNHINLSTLYNTTTAAYVADELELIIVNSTQDIIQPVKPLANNTAVLIGHPAYNTKKKSAKANLTLRQSVRLGRIRSGKTFDDLPYTEKEVKDIAKLLTSYKLKPTVVLDTAASEASFYRLKSPKILHVATHGFSESTGGTASFQLINCGLALTGAADTITRENKADGILTGYEASLLNLHDTELVTLSACESGVGDYFEGEGVQGLQRAFLLAGAQSVLMTLWNVNDQLAQQLMTDFYRYWLSGQSKPQALRKAQLNLRKQYPEPYYWGAFVLLGQ